MLDVNNSSLLLKLPFLLLYWWYLEAPFHILKFLIRYFIHTTQQLSLPLLLRTFFQPWKNENRKGFVGMARGVGITVRTFVILGDLIILAIFFLVEICVFLTWIAFPITSALLLYFALFKP